MIKSTLALLLAISLVGCTTVVPVKSKFPDVPAPLMVKCPQLKKLEDQPKLSDISKTITENYTTYYECAVKNDAWIEWYEIQKQIFESVK
jgi:hypothetical protein